MGLSLGDRLKLRLFGKVKIGYRKLEGWPDELPFYMARCRAHGFYETYPSGYDGILICPDCFNETFGTDIVRE